MSDETKLCPLRPVSLRENSVRTAVGEFGPCLQDRCAWYVPEHGCAVVAIGAVINQLWRPR